MSGATDPNSAPDQSITHTESVKRQGGLMTSSLWNAFVLSICLSVTILVFGSPEVMPDMPEQNQDQHDIQALNNDEVQAFLRNDVEALALVWSDDLVVTNPLNKLVTKQQVLGMVSSGFLKINSYSRKIEYSHEYNGTFVIAGTEEVIWGGRMPHTGKTESLRFTAIWIKQQGRWQEVARHANIVPQP